MIVPELSPGEEVILQVRPSPRALLPYFIITLILALSIIFTILAIVMVIGLIFLYLISFRPVRYFITTERIILLRMGALSIDRQEISYDSVRDFELDQRLGGRILNYGSIIHVTQLRHAETDNSSDSLGALRAVSHVSHPREILLIIRNLCQPKNDSTKLRYQFS